MNKEIEIRLLEIDKKSFVKQITSIGAEKKFAALQKRYVYDFNPVIKNKWIRLRTNGKESTLTIKEIHDKTKINGTEELEIIVSDFDKTFKILEELGYQYRSYQENYREMYTLNNVEISIDTWPFIPTYVELESKNEKDIYNLLDKIKYDKNNLTTLDVDSIYKDVYNIDIMNIKELKFDNNTNKKILSK